MIYYTILDNKTQSLIDSNKTELTIKQLLDFFEMNTAIEKRCRFSKKCRMFVGKNQTIFINR